MVSSVRIGVSKIRIRLLYAGCAVFCLVGVVLILRSDSMASVLFGILSIVFFGGGAVYAGRKMRNEPVTIELSAQGIRPHDGGFLPWENVAATGPVRLQGTVKCWGVRIVDYAAYAATFTEAERQRLRGGARLAQGVSYATVVASASQGVDFLQDMLAADDRNDMAALISVPGGADLGRMLAWNRKKTEWDLVWPQSTLDRKVEEIVRVCDELRARQS